MSRWQRKFCWRREVPAETWAGQPFYDGTWVRVYSVPGRKYRWVEVKPGEFEREYITEEGW